jgi:flagellar biosynthesis protein FlhF
MQVRKFEAADMSAALAAVKEAMGPEAVILTTRTLGRDGLFSRARVEVTAALEEAPKVVAVPESQSASHRIDDTVLEIKLAPLKREIQALHGTLRARQENDDLSGLRLELGDLRRILAGVGGGIVPGSANSLVERLETADVESGLARRLARQAVARGYDPALEPGSETDEVGHDRRNHAGQRAILEAVLAENLGGVAPESAVGRQIIAVVGPTGVGKTTTLAKLAARAALMDGKRVGLITVDTYRVGGIDQLRTYADLIKVGMHVAPDAQSFRRALDRQADCDLVFVDTAGRGPGDVSQIRNLADVFGAAPVEIHLVVAAPTGRRDLRRILGRYQGLPIAALLFTKLDEATGLGSILNAVDESKNPLSYVTFGQRVPEDMSRADPEALARQIVGGLFKPVTGVAIPEPYLVAGHALRPRTAEVTL